MNHAFGLRSDAWLVTGVAFATRMVACLWAFHLVPPTADGKFYHIVAQRIAQGDGYTWAWPDGAVTFAAHYPIGYPALMAVPYAIFGGIPGSMMVINALLGAIAVWATHGLCLDALGTFGESTTVRRSALIAGLLVALSPTLVGYTPALMTEGAVATFVALAARAALGKTRVSRLLVVLALTAAVYLRPQSILFAPVLGALSVEGAFVRKAAMAALVSLGCVALVAPWTLRNCDKMERCVFVSANGGWNLLIGTFPEGRGAWVALDGERVPPECRDVFQEAAKDQCFGEAGRRRIQTRFPQWLSLVPAKLSATLDHTAAASDHLSEAGTLNDLQKLALASAEYLAQRLSYLLALVGAWQVAGRRAGVGAAVWTKVGLLAVGVVGFAGLSAPLGWACVLVLLLLNPPSLRVVGVGYGAFSVLSTAVVHGVFFGAGRYALPLIVFTAPLTALGIGALLRRIYASTGRSEATEV